MDAKPNLIEQVLIREIAIYTVSHDKNIVNDLAHLKLHLIKTDFSLQKSKFAYF